MNKQKELRKIDKKQLKEWALAVKLRDGNKCIICGDSKLLNAHHLIPREVREFRYDIQNGTSLCPKHHQFSRLLSAHANSLAFLFWMEINRPEQLRYLREKYLPKIDNSKDL